MCYICELAKCVIWCEEKRTVLFVSIIHSGSQWVAEGDGLINHSAPAPSRHPSRNSLSHALYFCLLHVPFSAHLFAHVVTMSLSNIAWLRSAVSPRHHICRNDRRDPRRSKIKYVSRVFFKDFYFAHAGVRQYCDQCICLSVCLSFCPLAYLKNSRLNFTKFSVHITCGCGSVLLWLQCNMVMYFRFCGWRHVFT